jgi:hypothetical protein
MTRNTTGTYSGPYARFSASSRPIPPDFGVRRVTVVARPAGPPLDSARLTRAALVALPLFAVLAILASAPRSVTIPLAVLLLTGLAVNGAVALVDRRLR